MPANLNNPFGESCCDGGECSTSHESAQSCGCDKGANWVCQRHQLEAQLDEYRKAFFTAAMEEKNEHSGTAPEGSSGPDMERKPSL